MEITKINVDGNVLTKADLLHLLKTFEDETEIYFNGRFGVQKIYGLDYNSNIVGLTILLEPLNHD